MTGAPNFVSHAAMRAGAGIVWCNLPGRDAARAASGSEVITRAVAATPDDSLDLPGADEVLVNLGRFRALALGPGLGRSAHTALAVIRLVEQAAVPVVLDADGLNALDGRPEILRTRPAPTVLTPHDGEYERLVGHAVGEDRVAAAAELAARSGSVTLLKGPATVVADPDGRAAVNPTGARGSALPEQATSSPESSPRSSPGDGAVRGGRGRSLRARPSRRHRHRRPRWPRRARRG
ncbi:MAG: NAD(P)H-hydrate dehydratase [Acidimicrobiia bacterium]|nr:NAD(P)H-hydrate dehydratase [Acidimicrobiia bacterium]